jgi:sugar phosphate isomerase/epimerase
VAFAGDARPVCVENLENYCPDHLLPLLDEFPLGLCLDVGHFWLAGADPLPFLERHLGRTWVVHLHGVAQRGHQSLRLQGPARTRPILDLLACGGYSGVLTLEVFLNDFAPSRALVVEVVDGQR